MKRKQEEKPESRIAQLEKELAVTTRNLEIEAALERVRARAMAMQNSDELAGLVTTLFNELSKLHFTLARCLIWIIDAETLSATTWMANPGVEAASYQMQYFDHPYYKGIIKAWEARKPKWAYELQGEEKRALDNIVLNLPALKNTPEVVKAAMRAVEKAVISFSFANFGGLQVDGTEPLSEDNVDILARFSKVFDQTYTRFSDLKKAEAQAREAKIEAALEKVRSKSLGMHKTEELQEVVSVVFEKLQELEFVMDAGAIIFTFTEGSKDVVQWIANPGQSIANRFVTPFIDHPIPADLWRAKESGKDFFAKVYSFEEKNVFFKAAFQLSEYKFFPDDAKKAILDCENYSNSVALAKNSAILIPNYNGKLFSEQENDILKRFVRVFEQAYVRFLDLQKAEAQAREAQIELGLERVRAKTMAMHNSDDVADTVVTMFDELVKLGIEKTARCGIAIIDDNREMELWRASYNADGNVDRVIGHIDMTIHPLLAGVYQAWKNNEAVFSWELTGKDQEDYFRALSDSPEYPVQFDLASLPAKQINSVFFFPEGCVYVFTIEPISPGAVKLFKRFAGVFGLTYRRYLDLKKAEAQARQAQIEVAMERVRSRTMGMQKSEELVEVIQLTFEQFVHLNFTITNANFNTDYLTGNDANLWLASSSQSYPAKIFVPYADHPVFNIPNTARDKGEDHFITSLTFSEKNQFLDHFFKNGTPVPDLPLAILDRLYNAPGFYSYGVLMKTVSFAITNYEGYSYTEAEEAVVMRFGKVFEQTYTRFKDLEQAEEQARESQIQLALERVRARTMAMQKSEELAETAAVLFQQLLNLDISSERTIIGIPNDDTRKIEFWGTEQGGNQINTRFEYEADATYAFREIYKGWQEKRSELTVILKGKNLREHINYVRNVLHMPLLAELVQDQRMLYNAFFSKGWLEIVTPETQSKETLDILQRFAGVFDGTYTRFLDLQKAEAQAREAKIEASLERVRSKTMAMHNSQDVGETVAVMFDELVKLGVETTSRLGIVIIDDTSHMEVWTASADAQGKTSMRIGRLDMTIHPLFQGLHTAWKNKETVFSCPLAGEDVKAYYRTLNNSPDYPSQFNLDNLPKRQEYNSFIFPEGAIFIFSLQPLTTEITQIFKKFAGVFAQTYRRYLDLQKAEAQAREAKIEASLERVRSKTMAMHNSQDVGETVAVMFDELVRLGVETTARLGIVIIDETSNMEVWAASADVKGKTSISIGRLDMTINPILQALHTAWKNKQTMFSYPLAGEEIKAYYRALNNAPDYPSHFDIDALPEQQAHNSFLFAEGAIFIFSLQPLTTEITQIFKKFAGVFGQTYRRYLDLQKAEKQAREAQIEAALERVRSKAMAMRNSNDLLTAASTVFAELQHLDIKQIRSGVGLIAKDFHKAKVYSATSSQNAVDLSLMGEVTLYGHPVFEQQYQSWLKRENYFVALEGKELSSYYEILSTGLNADLGVTVKKNQKEYGHWFMFSEGFLYAWSDKEYTDAEIKILERFKNVIELTIGRYLELQKAETQAREAQIEASLERVRGKALAMYNSKDLSSTASLVFTELRKLGINSKRCGVALLSKNSRHTQLYVATTTEDTDSLDLVGAIELSGHPSLENQYESWSKNEDYFTVLKGEELKSYKELIYSMLPVPYDHSYHEEFGSYLAFSEGFLFSWAERPFSEVEINILNRFKSIIDLTFRRYIELQKSEANGREAIMQSSLDRVRAEIASMRTTGDLDRITPLIWNELTTLGVPFIRCGVFIMDEPLQLIHTYLSTPDGKAIAAFQLHFNADTGSGVSGAALQGWRQKRAVTLHWTEEEFRTFSHGLVEQGEITSEENYLTEHPPSGLDLHFFPFLQGMLYAGNTEPLSDDDKDLVQSLADAFSTAYARYEDFNRLELAKQQVEHTLSDLKSAQTKLVQSEKMASLGELTAGIAHEIQNPLNFVNNFSEVNQEMIEELEEELNAGNIEEALALAADIKQNEQKINHHGKRADGIVKGMLEHSRTGGGEKVPINMNALADEFMRLSYHGLRAKDKVFNAEMVTSFDPDLPKINVVGQDMGRVILNLFNNAFYAVNQKKKTADADYRPEVSVTTSAENGRVVIKVKDNGIGIPDAIKEKIMQPFFTTKPTGEGTGLGLSLTYDMVVKGHGGSIQVNSIEGEGSEFIISLPIN